MIPYPSVQPLITTSLQEIAIDLQFPVNFINEKQDGTGGTAAPSTSVARAVSWFRSTTAADGRQSGSEVHVTGLSGQVVSERKKAGTSAISFRMSVGACDK
jgi:hypothetical protein